MPYFICRSKPHLLATNLKAMFSTLTTQPQLERLSRPSQLWHSYLRSRHVREYGPQYLIVRDPYRRLISFFNDKFRQHPSGVQPALGYEEWQTCQKLFFPYLGVTRTTKPEEIRGILIDTSFEEFVTLLANVFQRDGHLRPQNRIRFVSIKGLEVGTFSVEHTLKMENAADMQFLSENLGVDTNTRHNATANKTTDDLYTPQLLATVNRLYAEDFREYGYDMHT
ncbi:MAG TPA: sulfotransferase family 2 domain-containing protein [Pirellulaceae bacterium]|nr:sulfotransferase family 2 domain-containing protein [Planctomycetales bacterium]MCB9938272.1 sulfotransferase family 2 domain-containing protein [Planctomycetaceae bacterium]HRX82330.1 sulfotransferase family 2 domain-containing protein [Pirellulaceae bacterium]